MRFLSLASQHRVVIILGLTLIISALVVPGYFSASTLGLGLDRAATIGLIAIGLTVLLIAGQIDLSGGAVFALAGIISVILQREIGILPAAIVGILVGTVAGAINGALVVGLKVNSLVLTLATMLIFRSLAHWITNSQPVSGTDIMLSLALAKTYLDIFTIRSALFIVLIAERDSKDNITPRLRMAAVVPTGVPWPRRNTRPHSPPPVLPSDALDQLHRHAL